MTRVDSDVGELVDTLKELGIDKNTLIVFAGDNGSSFEPDSEIGGLFKQDSNGLRGFKRSMYEGALRQAAFAWWPGTVLAGRVTDEPWAFWDMMPTFTELSSQTPPKGYQTDGHSLVSFLKGGPAPKRDYFYWELHEQKGAVRAARWGDWKAVLSNPRQPIEIYNITDDPGESNNLAAAKPELVEHAQAIFAASHQPHSDWPLDRRSEKQVRLSNEAWKIKRERDRTGWVPPNAKPLDRLPSSGESD